MSNKIETKSKTELNGVVSRIYSLKMTKLKIETITYKGGFHEKVV